MLSSAPLRFKLTMIHTVLITIAAIYVVSFIALICLIANELFSMRDRHDQVDPADKNQYR